LKKLLSPKELKLINPSDVYIVTLNNKEYFHLIDIEDGDFYGMDMGKNLYKITHNPYDLEKIDVNLSKLLDMN
jgi:uncharacterized pyridoxamine 5'-phosphate oxidase family protein